MECIRAQEIISQTLDRQPVNAEQLAEAKDHCRSCAECGPFVRAQLLVKQAPLPTPPADLADRIMFAVREEAAAEARAEQEAQLAAAAAAQAAAEAKAAAQRDAVPSVSLAPKSRRRLPRVWVSAGIAAAALIGLLGVVGVVSLGLHTLGGASSPTVRTQEFRSGSGFSSDAGSSQTFGAAPVAGAVPKASTDTTPQPAITVDGAVYLEAGQAPTGTVTSMPVLGLTTSSLAAGGTPGRHTVYGTLGADTVYVTNDQNVAFAFTRLKRTYRGITYGMVSADLDSYGKWPTLPVQIPVPANADGSPTFTLVSTESDGVSVYRLATSSVTAGIAIPPGTPAEDPAHGNPNWTWWAVLR